MKTKQTTIKLTELNKKRLDEICAEKYNGSPTTFITETIVGVHAKMFSS